MELHRCRFIEDIPSGVECLALNASSTQLAVGRSNGNIEIWTFAYRWALEKTILGSDRISVHSLLWIEDERLFSSGLHGEISEWDLDQLVPKTSIPSNGGAVWSIAVNSTGDTLAVACEDGRVRLFDISHGQLEYLRAFNVKEGQALSVDWHENGLVLVSGHSNGEIYIWEVARGRSTASMKVDIQGKKDILVWDIKVLSTTNTIVSSDSSGNIMFWDANQGTLKASFRQHTGDALTLGISDNERVVYSGGVDGNIVQYRLVTNRLVNIREEPKWTFATTQRFHTHDVRAIALSKSVKDMKKSVIVSGGVDTQPRVIPEWQFGSKLPRQLPLFPDSFSRGSLARIGDSRLFSYRFDRRFEVWLLGEPEKGEEIDQSVMEKGDVEKVEVKAIPSLLVKGNIAGGNNLSTVVLSPNGSHLACSDSFSNRLFSIDFDESDQTCSISRLDFPALPGAMHMVFTSDSNKLLLVAKDGRIYMVDIKNSNVHSFEGSDEHPRKKTRFISSPAVIGIAVSNDGQWLATRNSESTIAIYNMDTLKFERDLPKLSTAVTSISFHSIAPVLAVSCSNNSIQMFDVEHGKLTDWSRLYHNSMPANLTKHHDVITHMLFDRFHPTSLIVSSQSWFCAIDMRSPVPTRYWLRSRLSSVGGGGSSRAQSTDGSTQKPPDSKQKEKTTVFDTRTKLVTRYHPLLFVSTIGMNEMIIVERPWVHVLEGLPPPIYRHKFGT